MASERLIIQAKLALAQHCLSRSSASDYDVWARDFAQLLADYDFTVGGKGKRDDQVKAWVEENIQGLSRAMAQGSVPIPEVDSEERWEDMNRYMAVPNWDYLVDTIHKVERSTTGEITVYFTSRHGEKIKETGRLCKARLPKKLLAFYEENLRWDNGVVNGHY